MPSTFGAKVAVWIDELCRHAERLRQLEPRAFVAMLGGGAGTAASFQGHGAALQRRMGQLLGLGSMPLPGRTIYDHLTEYVLALAMLGTSCGKAAREVRTLMADEFAEVEEPVPPGAVGSSTMPRSAIRSSAWTSSPTRRTCDRWSRSQSRRCTASHEGRRQPLHDATATAQAVELTGDILVRLRPLARPACLPRASMRQNAELSGGLIMSGA